ncbi:DNA topology modulation protein [Bdellovibrionota bacterium]
MDFNQLKFEKILVLGSSGSGKSTFATKLGKKLGNEVIHLDRHFWKPNWTKPSREEWHQTNSELAQKPKWIIDGNFCNSLNLRMPHADTIIYLDFPKFLCLYRVLIRRFKFSTEPRPDMGEGCAERIDFEFLKYIWTFNQKIRPEIFESIKEHKKEKNLIILSGTKEVSNFLKAFG